MVVSLKRWPEKHLSAKQRRKYEFLMTSSERTWWKRTNNLDDHQSIDRVDKHLFQDERPKEEHENMSNRTKTQSSMNFIDIIEKIRQSPAVNKHLQFYGKFVINPHDSQLFYRLKMFTSCDQTSVSNETIVSIHWWSLENKVRLEIKSIQSTCHIQSYLFIVSMEFF